jgi:hypothetical protein
MTYASEATPTSAGAAVLPAVASIILALIWGAYTALVAIEIFSTSLPG